MLKLSSRPPLSIPKPSWKHNLSKVGTLRQELERLPGPKISAGAIGRHGISTLCGSHEETVRPGGTTMSVLGRSSVKKFQRDFNARRDH